jgi:hypothetical protein
VHCESLGYDFSIEHFQVHGNAHRFPFRVLIHILCNGECHHLRESDIDGPGKAKCVKPPWTYVGGTVLTDIIRRSHYVAY